METDTIRTETPESMDDGTATKDDRRLLPKSDAVNGSAQAEIQDSPESLEELEKKYAPYVRRDSYGVMGRGELPWTEKALLAFALVVLVPLRVAAATTCVVVCYLACRICTAFREDEQEDYAHLSGWRRSVIMRAGKFCSRGVLFAFGFYRIHETHRKNGIHSNLNSKVLHCFYILDFPITSFQ